MQETEHLPTTNATRPPAILRSRVLTALGWTLLLFALALFLFHVTWMWRRMGSGAPMVAIGLALDALVGIGLIVAGARARRRT